MNDDQTDYEGLAFRHAPDATLVLAQRIVIRASLAVESVFGWTPAEIEGQSMRLLYPGQTDFEQVGERALRALESAATYRDERLMRRKNGQIVWMEARGRALDPAHPFRLAIWTYRPIGAEPDAAGPLTATEKRIARHLVNGLTSKEIAQAMSRSPRTIEVHRANMIRKMQVRNSFELVSRLLNSGEG